MKEILLDINDIDDIFISSYERATSGDPEGWEKEIPARFQCFSTSMLLLDILNATLVKEVIYIEEPSEKLQAHLKKIGRKRKIFSHYRVRVDGTVIDPSRGQLVHWGILKKKKQEDIFFSASPEDIIGSFDNMNGSDFQLKYSILKKNVLHAIAKLFMCDYDDIVAYVAAGGKFSFIPKKEAIHTALDYQYVH